MKKVAIIGTGIAGMSCAAKLHPHFDISVFEKNDYIGGHTNTVTVSEGQNAIPIDTGFMVYNETTYPELTKLFRELGVKTKPTSMSFSVQHSKSNLEFAGTGWGGLFAQRKNLFKPSYFRFLGEIDRFNRTCREVLISTELQSMTLSKYCEYRGFSEAFREKYLIPMSGAVWSSPPDQMLNFPAITLIRFFSNHRFLGLHGQLEWRTVDGGSKQYRDMLIKPFRDRIHVNRGAKKVTRTSHGVRIEDLNGKTEDFDVAVLASHADESFSIIDNKTPLQNELLKRFRYQKNSATLHTDESVMPKAKAAWTSWNYRVDPEGPSIIYWMNQLQNVSKIKNYFVSINDPGKIRQNQILKTIAYDHPLYTVESIQAQTRLPELNQEGPLYFCGSYFNYGFHEDALVSGLEAAKAVLSRE